MALALFDLDHTLIAGDCDQLWGDYLAARGLVAPDYQARKQRYFADYQAGTLDFAEFAEFVLEPLARLGLAELMHLRAGFARDALAPAVLPRAKNLVAEHRAAGDRVLIITATNRFIAEPAAAFFGVSELIATEPERVDGRFTGRVAGLPSFREGKVKRLAAWLAEHGGELESAHFYSDSHNDLPLLGAVGHPVAVDPDAQLRATAQARGWRVLSLRDS